MRTNQAPIRREFQEPAPAIVDIIFTVTQLSDSRIGILLLLVFIKNLCL